MAINRTQLIEQIAEATGETKVATARFLTAFLDSVQTNVASGEKVTIVGFGTFEQKTSAGRVGRNPGTGESITIPAKTRPKFSPGSAFINAVNQ